MFLAQEKETETCWDSQGGKRRVSDLFRKNCSPGNLTNGWRGYVMITHSGHLDLIIATFADNKWVLSEASLIIWQWQKLMWISGQKDGWGMTNDIAFPLGDICVCMCISFFYHHGQLFVEIPVVKMRVFWTAARPGVWRPRFMASFHLFPEPHSHHLQNEELCSLWSWKLVIFRLEVY